MCRQVSSVVQLLYGNAVQYRLYRVVYVVLRVRNLLEARLFLQVPLGQLAHRRLEGLLVLDSCDPGDDQLPPKQLDVFFLLRG